MITRATLTQDVDPASGLHTITLYPDHARAAGHLASFSDVVIDDVLESFDDIANQADQDPDLSHVIIRSAAPKVFCLGGDLPHIVHCIKGHHRSELLAYVNKACVYAERARSRLHPRVHTIALVQGAAVGGGFEVALSCETMIAEKGTKFGLPEINFGSFPGVGGFSFLSRIVGPVVAARMMVSGRTYTAEELFEMGVVCVLAEPGQGLEVARDLAAHQRRQSGALIGMKRVKDVINPVTLTELEAIADIWVDTMMALTPTQVGVLDQMLAAQQSRSLRS